MKDNMQPCQHTLSDDVVYKEVVVIGNGPSGMVTSFMLAGNVPYLKPVPEDLPIDEMLKARLSNIPPGQSLYECDLMALAEGLEGRSQNPIPLLMDNLLRPCTDMGIQADSLIEWKHDIEKQIEHVVLGRGPPGGAWPTFPRRVRTLSPGAWLTLPPHAAAGADRLPAAAVAKYCRRYVRDCKLQRYFRCGVVVTGVRPARAPAREPCGARACPHRAAFCVTGYDLRTRRPLRFLCRRVVVASGGGDRPNTLEPVAQHALHALADVDRAVTLLARANSSPPPAVLVVGSGVSAADAVWLALRGGLRVRHAHRAPADALARLSPRAYPDYCQVYKMMCDGQSGKYKNYANYPHHVITEVTPETDTGPTVDTEDLEQALTPKRVKLLNVVTNEVTEITVSLIAVLIGSKPDLFFLQTNFNLNCIEVNQCAKCTKEVEKKMEENQRQCFLKNHWLYFKSVLGQSIQSCKSRYLNYTEINGNTDADCDLPDCNRQKKKCMCNVENGGKLKRDYEIIPYSESFDDKIDCLCQSNPYSNGIGFGIDKTKPVDCRLNPVAIDKSTHEMLYAPKGIYALGPLTADNFVRFIPGGALAIVADIHKERKNAE